MCINRVALSGNLVRDAELRTTANGKQIVRFTLAVDQFYQNSQGEKQKRVHYFGCTLFRTNAEKMLPHLFKGAKVALEGRLDQQRWQDDAGKWHSRIGIIVDGIDFMISSQTSAMTSAKADAESFPQTDDSDSDLFEGIEELF